MSKYSIQLEKIINFSDYSVTLKEKQHFVRLGLPHCPHELNRLLLKWNMSMKNQKLFFLQKLNKVTKLHT